MAEKQQSSNLLPAAKSETSKVYSKVIDILKELAATGNVKDSLDKIDVLIDKL